MTVMMATEGGTTPRFTRTAVAPRLVFQIVRENGQAAARTITTDGDTVRIGSHEGNEIVVVGMETVSRFHCRVERTPRAWRLVDQGSLNGTRVDGVTMRDGDLPVPGCRIEVGDSVIVVGEEPASTKIETLDQASFGDLYGASLPMRRLFAVLDRVCASEANVLIEGASGTGKELVATEVRAAGPSAAAAVRASVDCSAIAPNVRGRALRSRPGRVHRGRARPRRRVRGGPARDDLPLRDWELPLEMQPKLLRALEAGEDPPGRRDPHAQD